MLPIFELLPKNTDHIVTWIFPLDSPFLISYLNKKRESPIAGLTIELKGT